MQLKDKNKKCGLLLSVTSLPSNHGIGSLGAESYKFIDFLKETKQDYWQMLPINPVGKGNSPYSSISSFAGEILLIDLDLLQEEGYIKKWDMPERIFSKNTDYNAVRSYKTAILKKAVKNFDKENAEFLKFKNENEFWLGSYSLFMSISEHFSTKNFRLWDKDFKYKKSEALSQFKKQNDDKISFYEVTQFFFFKQFSALKKYAQKNGIKLIGDIPFYVGLGSADVWENPENFLLDNDLLPTLVAGVPPDMFSKDGQLWESPIYNWAYQRKNNYSWWKKRLVHLSKLFDVIRIDHFRAFTNYYTIPHLSKTAKQGRWEKGVGFDFWKEIKPYLENTKIIAEDLGEENDDVQKLIKKTKFPNMKVLQFAFDSDLKDPFLPKNMNRNCVCYTGTHDNDTTLGWYKKATVSEKMLYHKLVPDLFSSVPLNLIAFGMKSKANTVIVPLQDYLELNSTARLNTPGKALFNWEWRAQKSDFDDFLKQKILTLTNLRKQKN